MDIEAAVNQHYGVDFLEDRVKATLTENGLDRSDLSWTDLSHLDQFHVGGAHSSRALADFLGVEPGQTLLDIGSGLGGPARFLAGERGAVVTGLDLNPAYVRIATDLSARAGLSGKTRFVEANALRMPFADGSFALAWTQHTAMNIADREGLYREIHRVLKPGGRFAIHDVVLGNGDSLEFPLPWSDVPETSAVISVDDMNQALQGAGFREIAFRDVTADANAFFAAQMVRREAEGAKAPTNLTALIGPQFAPLLANLARHVNDGRLRIIQTIQQAA